MKSGLDGIMLGQSAMCNPWSLVSYKPDAKEIYDVSIRHLHYNLANERYFNQESSFDSESNTLIQPKKNNLEDICEKIKQ